MLPVKQLCVAHKRLARTAKKSVLLFIWDTLLKIIWSSCFSTGNLYKDTFSSWELCSFLSLTLINKVKLECLKDGTDVGLILKNMHFIIYKKMNVACRLADFIQQGRDIQLSRRPLH